MYVPDDIVGKEIVKIGSAENKPPEKEPEKKEPLVLRGHRDEVWSVAFSPDGMRLASASLDQSVKVWDAATART